MALLRDLEVREGGDSGNPGELFFFLTARANFLNHGENFRMVIGRMKTKNLNSGDSHYLIVSFPWLRTKTRRRKAN